MTYTFARSILWGCWICSGISFVIAWTLSSLIRHSGGQWLEITFIMYVVGLMFRIAGPNEETVL